MVRFLLARRFLPGLAMAPKNIDRSLLKPLAGLSLWFAVIDIALVLLVRIDVVVVGLAVGVAAAGVYAVGQKLVLAVHQLTLPATRMFFPHSSELEARRDVVGLQESLISGTRITLAVAAPICLTMSLLAQPILQAWVGHGFEGAGPVVIFLAAALVITIIPRTGLLMLQGIGRARGPALVITGEAILNVGLSVLLAKQIGLKGVALGTLIAAAVANLGVLLPYVSRAFDLGVGTFIVSLGRAHLLPAIGATSVALVLRQFNPDQIPTAIGACLLTIATYVVLLARTGLTTRERRQLLMQLRTWRTQEVTSSV